MLNVTNFMVNRSLKVTYQSKTYAIIVKNLSLINSISACFFFVQIPMLPSATFFATFSYKGKNITNDSYHQQNSNKPTSSFIGISSANYLKQITSNDRTSSSAYRSVNHPQQRGKGSLPTQGSYYPLILLRTTPEKSKGKTV